MREREGDGDRVWFLGDEGEGEGIEIFIIIKYWPKNNEKLGERERGEGYHRLNWVPQCVGYGLGNFCFHFYLYFLRNALRKDLYYYKNVFHFFSLPV